MVHINKFPSNCDLWNYVIWESEFADQLSQTDPSFWYAVSNVQWCLPITLFNARVSFRKIFSWVRHDVVLSDLPWYPNVSYAFSFSFFFFFWLITRLPTTPQTQLHTSQASYLLLVPDPPRFVLLPISKLSISAFASEKEKRYWVSLWNSRAKTSELPSHWPRAHFQFSTLIQRLLFLAT